MICKKCGRKNSDNAQTCVYCGALLEPVLPKEPQAPGELSVAGLSADEGLLSGGSLSAAMISDAKATNAAKDDSPVQAADSAAVASAAGSAAGKTAGGSPRPSGRPIAMAADTSSEGARPQPQMPYARQPVPMQSPARTKIGDDPPVTERERHEGKRVITRTVVMFVLAAFFISLILTVNNQQEPTPPSTRNYTPAYNSEASDSIKYYFTPTKPPATDPSTAKAPASEPDPAAQTATGFDNPVVILDDADVKISIDVGSGRSNANSFYDIDCLIENKAGRSIGILFEEVSAVQGFEGKQYNVHFYRAEFEGEDLTVFVPGENKAYLSFDQANVSGDIVLFTGTVLVYDYENGAEIGRHTVVIDEL